MDMPNDVPQPDSQECVTMVLDQAIIGTLHPDIMIEGRYWTWVRHHMMNVTVNEGYYSPHHPELHASIGIGWCSGAAAVISIVNLFKCSVDTPRTQDCMARWKQSHVGLGVCVRKGSFVAWPWKGQAIHLHLWLTGSSAHQDILLAMTW